MNKPSYRVILLGTIREGFDRKKVVANLAATFKKDPRVFDKLLSGTPKPIRTGADFATARKIEVLITKAGAHCSVELEATKEAESLAPPSSPDIVSPKTKPAPSQPAQPESASVCTDARVHPLPESISTLPAILCPRCGYRPTSEMDVLVVRGDCPKCGFQVRKPEESENKKDEGSDLKEEENQLETLYPMHRPASDHSRRLAVLHSFTLFLWVYFWVSLTVIALLHPFTSLPTLICLKLLDTLLNTFPLFIVSITVILTSCVLPLVNQGRTWGQWMMDINVVLKKRCCNRR